MVPVDGAVNAQLVEDRHHLFSLGEGAHYKHKDIIIIMVSIIAKGSFNLGNFKKKSLKDLIKKGSHYCRSGLG